jgi:hypothetical protein
MHASIAHRVFQARLWTPAQLNDRLLNQGSTTDMTSTISSLNFVRNKALEVVRDYLV